MDKIRELLVNNGLNEEAANAICQQLVEYKQSVRRDFETEYSSKLATAKQACLEETESYKRDLAKRLQIFCEAKGPAIEATIAKQTTIGEAKAMKQLQGIKNLLEGIVPSDSGKSQAEIRSLRQQLKAVSESRDKAISTSNRHREVAQKALTRAKMLEGKLAASSSISESKKAPVTKPATGKSAKPSTHRLTLQESQSRRVPQQRQSGASNSIEAIAQSIDN